MFMAQFVPHGALKATFPVAPIHGPFGSVRGCPEVRNAGIATCTVESLSHSSEPELEVTGMLSQHGCAQEDQRFPRTRNYVVHADKADYELPWNPGLQRPVPQGGLIDVSIPNFVRELGNCCFKWRSILRRVTFGPSSSLERIGVSCFEESGVEEVSIPDSVRELCDCCFKGCRFLGRVTFGSSSSLERIGVSCFESSGVEEVSIPDSVREL